MIRLAVYQPDIPQNMGTILRLGACLDVPIDVIGPTGFDFSDQAVRRAGMDYIANVDLARHISFEKYKASPERRSQRLVLCTTKSDQCYADFEFNADDTIMLGRESSGVPEHVHEYADASVTIPLANKMRSLNVAVAGAMIIGEALRQTKGFS